ncbi:MAG: hypothetical protein ACOYM2_01650 [Rectinemataceae bacterium]
MHKTLLISILIGLSVVANAQDIDGRITALERDNERIMAAIDELRKKQGDNEPFSLNQEIQWGKGWALDTGFAAGGIPAQIRLGVASPKAWNLLSAELLGSGFSTRAYSQPATGPRTYESVYGLQIAARVTAWTPMYFTFTRLYGCMEGALNGLSSSTGGGIGSLQYTLGANVLFGMELYLANWISLYGETGGSILEHLHVGPVSVPSDLDYLSGPLFTAGLRFYLGK